MLGIVSRTVLAAMLLPVGVAMAQGPRIVLTPTNARFDATAQSGLTATQTIRITNSGRGTLRLSSSIVYAGGQPTGWLTATLSSVSAPANLTLRANAFPALQPGTYTATVAVAASGAKINRQSVSVMFVVAAVPVISLSPASQDYGAVVVGHLSAPQGFVVRNAGSAPLAPLSSSNFSFTGANPADFIVNSTCPSPIAPGASCTVDVAFAPQAAGKRTATFTVTASPGGTATAAVSGTGIAAVPVISLTPSTQDYPAVVVGHLSPPQGFVVTNTGTAPLGPLLDGNFTFTGANPGDFVVNRPCPNPIAPGASCAVDVDFFPQAAGARTATFTVTASPGGTATAEVTGTGVTPTLIVTPTSYDFGSLVLGLTSPEFRFTVTNTGTSPAQLSSFQSTGIDFVGTGSDCDLNHPLLPQGSCTIGFAFHPQNLGVRTGRLILSNGGSADLTGTGVVAVDQLTVTPTSHDFGSLVVGQSSAPFEFTITNTGNAPTGGLGLVVQGPDYNLAPGTCTEGLGLNPGGGCTFTVTFAPHSAGLTSGGVTVGFSDPSGVLHAKQVTVEGMGIPAVATITVTPVGYDFGSVVVGQSSAPVNFTITNTGNAPAGGLGLVLQGSPDYNLAPGTCREGDGLDPGASCTFTVTFAPHSAGLTSGGVTVGFSDPSGVLHTKQVTVEGMGTLLQATLALSPGSFDFGTVQVNTASPSKQFVVVNTGPDPSGPITVTLSGSDAADFGVAGDCQGATLAGNSSASCHVDVTFAPHAYGPRAATVTISGTPGGTSSATLTGTGDGVLTLAPTAQDFGSVAVGQSGTPVAFTVTNDGSTDVVINHFTTSGPNFFDFLIDPGTCGPALAPTGSCTFTVRFAPLATGARAAILTVTGAGGAPTASANLTGTGGASAALTFAPASFDFGNRQVNFTMGGVFFFTISNTGGAATAPLDQFVFTGAAAADFSIDDQHCLGVSLAPGASCDLSVQFIPHTTGQRSATLTVSSSTGGASGSAQVSGTGVPPTIFAVTPPTINFGSVDLGQTSPVFTYTLTNTGPSPGGFFVTDSFIGVGKADYNQLTSECWGNPVDVGASCRFTVSFSPKAGGARPATLTMVFQGGTATVTFTGFGTSNDALLAVAPDSQDFGLVFLGASSAIKTVTVTNVGHTISSPVLNFLFSGPGAYEFGVPDASNQCNGRTLAPGASCTVGLIFTPQVYGRRAATLAISDGGIPGTVKLTGGMTPGGVLSMTPTAKNFGTIPVGSSSLATQFTVTNTGTTIALLSGLFIDDEAGDDYALEPGSSCASAPFIDIGASCSILVHFKPKRTGPLPATLYVYHDGGTVSADLTGTGGPATPTPTVGDGGTIELTSFTATDAARDLLGVPTLTDAQRAYLDRFGNHDSTYDLGDLIAFLDRHHIKINPAMLAAQNKEQTQ